MRIFLRDRKESLCNAWKQAFKDYLNIKCSFGDIFEPGEHLEVEAIISPANSFGFMDGGIDYAYSEYFGWEMSEELRAKIWENHNGELLVGQAEIVYIKKSKIKYLISAPTMRVPMDVSNTVNAYLAFLAALRCARTNGIESILCPCLATAIGKMSPEVCAKQMFEAYKSFEAPKYFDLLGTAYKNHFSMIRN